MKQNYTPKEEREIAIYGCLLEHVREGIEESFGFHMRRTAKATMIAMSLMSDAQEEMAMGFTNNARQTLNRAKWVLAEYVMDTETEHA